MHVVPGAPGAAPLRANDDALAPVAGDMEEVRAVSPGAAGKAEDSACGEREVLGDPAQGHIAPAAFEVPLEPFRLSSAFGGTSARRPRVPPPPGRGWLGDRFVEAEQARRRWRCSPRPWRSQVCRTTWKPSCVASWREERHELLQVLLHRRALQHEQVGREERASGTPGEVSPQAPRASLQGRAAWPPQ